MESFFWLATIIMSVFAFAFIVHPLIKSGRHKFVVALGVGIPLFSASVYSVSGSPNVASGQAMPTTAFNSSTGSNSTSKPEKVGSVSSMVEGLAQRLKENPDDGKGWLLLARSYKHLNRIEDAANAYAAAMELGENDPDLDKLAVLQTEPEQIVSRISGQLSLSDNATSVVQPTDTVFIFARATSGSGIPAAVVQKPARDFPMSFVLDDSRSMVDGIKLSDFREVVVTARISRSGVATEALQGLEAKSNPIVISEQKHVALVIE